MTKQGIKPGSPDS